jgi:MscS family membrane protein
MLERFQQTIGNGIPFYIWNGLVAFATVMIIGFFLKYFLQTAGRKLISKTENELDDRLLDVIIPRLKWLAIVIGLYLGIEEIAKGFSQADKTGQQLIQYGEGILYILFVSLITLLITRLIDTSLKYTIRRYASHASSALNTAILPLLNRLTIILTLFIAIVISLGHFGVDVSSLLVFLGGGSVAIALAAQETLSNMIAGFMIMIDRPFRVGDRIKLPTGEIGDVYEIGLRSSTILDFDNNLIICPNSELTKAKVVNYSYPGTEIRIIVEATVAYGTSIDRAREIMLGYANQHTGLLKQPAPEFFFSAMGESSCTLQLIARTDNWKKKGRIEAELREQIYTAFIQEGISSGYAQHVVQLTTPLPNASAKND